jgi:hypothetical protein
VVISQFAKFLHFLIGLIDARMSTGRFELCEEFLYLSELGGIDLFEFRLTLTPIKEDAWSALLLP